MGSLSATVAPDGSVRVTCDGRGEVAELLRLLPALTASSFPLEELSRTPAGPGEAVRKTLVFHLVSELFELSRG